MSSKKIPNLKITLLGQKNIGKSELVKEYMNSSKSIKPTKKDKDIEKENKISFIKEFESSQFKFKISINKYSEKSEKIINNVNESHCVIIIFDMSSRKSFEKLLDDWLIFLRDSCNYKGKVFIFGKHYNVNEPLMTDEDEINEMIRVSEVNCKFYNIGKNDTSQNNAIFDKLINTALEYEKANSVNKKDCNIF